MSDDALRKAVLELLAGGQAHLDFEAAVADLPESLRGVRPPGMPHTPWRILEHLRIAQWDILRYCLDPTHVSPEFPAGYWPAGDGPPAAESWDASVNAFRSDLDAVRALVSDPRIDLLSPIPHGDGHTYLREALLVADHNAYHLGQLVAIRRALGAWPDD